MSVFTKNDFLTEVTLLENGNKPLTPADTKRWSIQYDLFAIGMREPMHVGEGEGSYIESTTSLICEGANTFTMPMETLGDLLKRYTKYHEGNGRIL